MKFLGLWIGKLLSIVLLTATCCDRWVGTGAGFYTTRTTITSYGIRTQKNRRLVGIELGKIAGFPPPLR